MIVIILAFLGFVIGFRTAKKRGGNRLDILQYTAGYTIAFVLLGALATVVIEQMLT